MARINPQSSREELTQVSVNVVLTQTQIYGFVKNGKIDLHKCLNEVNRRALNMLSKNRILTCRYN